MPIYAYRCEECGFAKDVLQKMSDDPLSNCPSCGKSSFKKQVTAAGFQLKGSGWYVTDFRGGSGGATAPAANSESDAPSSSSAESGKDSGTDATTAKVSAASTASTSSPTSASNPTPATPTSTS